ncbi:transcriptional regulator, AsnC family [Lutibacter agarilyticus]|uniref:Transcriptional regulator, AsnC family n=1 Tax=Lutibacter agarilyticus TaxID=1109740 RepID=A0A238WBZ1_9FLAO|nr:Lrp/AsnC family transcriptional regulator [Lutibacter agarilyticus]SNR44072.1 transcriptional regulator, AsnC family [Lutibacter agarilyticus]
MHNLDKIDQQILMLLQQNSKMNIKEIALKVGLTTTPTYDRIKRLEKSGIITRYVAELNKEKVGLDLVVFCQVTLQVHSKKLITQFENAVEKMPEVIECFHIAGNFDYLLKIVTPNIKSYQFFLKNKLSVLESVANVQSNFVMSTVKENSMLHIA